jgi:hypothetical protein
LAQARQHICSIDVIAGCNTASLPAGCFAADDAAAWLLLYTQVQQRSTAA